MDRFNTEMITGVAAESDEITVTLDVPKVVKGVGKSAYEIAVDNGFVGTEEEWLASLKGADGNPGLPGEPGENGADGYSPIVTVIQTDEGATISITDASGTTTAAITNGIDGANGKDGYTPIKGVDYWTELDIESLVVELMGYQTGFKPLTNGVYDFATGIPTPGETGIMAPLSACTPSTNYLLASSSNDIWWQVTFFNRQKQYLGTGNVVYLNKGTLSTPDNAHYMGFSCEDANDTTIKLYVT